MWGKFLLLKIANLNFGEIRIKNRSLKMFSEYTKIYIQKDESIKKTGLVYTIHSNGKVIGTLQETEKYSKRVGDRFLKLFSLFFLATPKRMIIEKLELQLVDEEGKLFGSIEKEIGFDKDLILYSKSGEQIATVKSNVKMKSPSITVVDETGNELLQAKSSYGATDFLVRQSLTNKHVSSIRKRSLVYETIKENLLNNDVYHIENRDLDERITFSLIAMGVAMDIYFHAGQ